MNVSTVTTKRVLVVVHDHTTAPETLRSMFSHCRDRFNEVFQHQLDDAHDLWPLMHNMVDSQPEGTFIVFELQLANHGIIRTAQNYVFTELPQITLAHNPILGAYING
jgi:hypothetical protein